MARPRAGAAPAVSGRRERGGAGGTGASSGTAGSSGGAGCTGYGPHVQRSDGRCGQQPFTNYTARDGNMGPAVVTRNAGDDTLGTDKVGHALPSCRRQVQAGRRHAPDD